ncbi:hypothetical protein EVAR_42885_1 [Eumeta japonica]|uniref:Uncharacterized protein n=1 Tax=Eumeta variegata TaxID=151549 RepID=A0A4C1YDX7_EUMVA|nr:hypothetical protein EVAR_42885_1 [Eumeta japonica]
MIEGRSFHYPPQNVTNSLAKSRLEISTSKPSLLTGNLLADPRRGQYFCAKNPKTPQVMHKKKKNQRQRTLQRFRGWITCINLVTLLHYECFSGIRTDPPAPAGRKLQQQDNRGQTKPGEPNSSESKQNDRARHEIIHRVRADKLPAITEHGDNWLGGHRVEVTEIEINSSNSDIPSKITVRTDFKSQGHTARQTKCAAFKEEVQRQKKHREDLNRDNNRSRSFPNQQQNKPRREGEASQRPELSYTDAITGSEPINLDIAG